MRALPPSAVLTELIDYDSCSGAMLWRPRDVRYFASAKRPEAQMKIFNARYAGTQALNCLDSHGYLHGNLLGRRAAAHRVAYKMATGKEPTLYVDHINGVPTDNRAANLRQATPAQSAHNTKGRSHHAKGVYLCRQTQLWAARISISGKTTWLGRFDTEFEAAAAYDLAATGLHGDFARLNALERSMNPHELSPMSSLTGGNKAGAIAAEKGKIASLDARLASCR